MSVDNALVGDAIIAPSVLAVAFLSTEELKAPTED